MKTLRRNSKKTAQCRRYPTIILSTCVTEDKSSVVDVQVIFGIITMLPELSNYAKRNNSCTDFTKCKDGRLFLVFVQDANCGVKIRLPGNGEHTSPYISSLLYMN